MADLVGKWTVEGLTKLKNAINAGEEVSITHFVLSGHKSLAAVANFTPDENYTEATFPNEVYRDPVAFTFIDENGLLTVQGEITADVASEFFANGIGLIFEDVVGLKFLMAVGELALQQHAQGVFQSFVFKLPIVNDIASAISVTFDPTDRVSAAQMEAAIGAHDSDEGAHPDRENIVGGVLMGALDMAALANRELDRFRRVRIQEGETTIYNRGIIKDCAITRKASDVRILSLASGHLFKHGRSYSVGADADATSVPPNPGASSATCYVYLYIDGSGVVQCQCTALDTAAPAKSLVIYTITVPAGSIGDSDAFTITDARRIEPGWPNVFTSPACAAIALPYILPDMNYACHLELVSCEGGRQQVGEFEVLDRLTNGFKIYLAGAADAVCVRYTVRRMI